MTVANKLENPTINPMFNDPNADITFCSEDGVHFRLQRKYLEANTGAFPGAEFETRGEIVHLTESAAVLSILFGFTHPKEHPDVEVLAFKTLEAVAEAAEKYEVFFAMNICRLQMKQFLAKHPLEILAHAAKHDYPKLISDVSLYLVRFPLLYVAEQLPSRYTIPWLRYHAKWDSVFGEAAKSLLAIRVAKPSTGHPHSHYFTGSLEPQACHSCIVAMLTTIQELKELTSIEELRKALQKPRPPLMTCISASCQYTVVISKVCVEMTAKIDSIGPFSINPPT